MGCGGGGVERGGGGALRVVPLVVALDLSAEQTEGEGWARRVLRRASRPLSALGVRLEVRRFVSIESTEGARPLSLEALSDRLEALRRLSEGSGSPVEAGGLWLAVTSFPPGSFPRLSELALSRPHARTLAVRRLSGLGGLAEGAELSEGRLLARAVASALGAVEGCEADAMSMSRDSLLGWRAPLEVSAAPPLAPQGSPLSSPLAPRAPMGQGAPPQASRLPRLPPLTFSARNVSLTRAEGPCERLALLDRACAAQQPSARLYAHACYRDAEAWAGALGRGELGVEAWEEERAIGRGAEARLRGDVREAFARCSPVADHSPGGFAAWCAGEAAAALGDSEAAIRYLRAYLSARPDEVRATLLLAKLLGRGGDHLSAAALLSSVVAQGGLTEPQRSEALYNLGVARAQVGDWRGADEAWAALPPGSDEASRAAPLRAEARARGGGRGE